MPNRIIKESIWTSPNLNQVSDMAERHFYRLLPLPDDHGCCQLTPLVVKGRCYPLKPDVTVDLIQIWTNELVQMDIIRTWEEKGRLYGYFPTWSEHQRVRSLHQRRTPEPPSTVVNCRQLSSNDRLNPNPNLNPNPKLPCPPKAVDDHGFSLFWIEYPRKEAKKTALRAWLRLLPSQDQVETILAAVRKSKLSPQWLKDNGQFIPLPATWLNAARWEDEGLEAPKQKTMVEMVAEIRERKKDVTTHSE